MHPQWAKSLAEIRKAFPSPFKESPDRLLEQVTKGIKKLDELKQKIGGPGFLGQGPFNPGGPDYKTARIAKLPHHDLGNLDKIRPLFFIKAVHFGCWKWVIYMP